MQANFILKSILSQSRIPHRIFKQKVSLLCQGILFPTNVDAALSCLRTWACSLKASLNTYTSHCRLLCSNPFQLLNYWITAMLCHHATKLQAIWCKSGEAKGLTPCINHHLHDRTKTGKQKYTKKEFKFLTFVKYTLRFSWISLLPPLLICFMHLYF